MKIQVYLKNNVYIINCGTGAQKIRWLVEAATLRHDQQIMFMTGMPKFAKLQDGVQLNLNDRISERLHDNARIWVSFEQFASTNVSTTDKKGAKNLLNNSALLNKGNNKK